MAEGKVSDRRSAEAEGRTRPGADGIGTGATARRTREGERAAIRAHSGSRKKAARCRREDKRRRQSFTARRSDRGRYRAGRLELDPHSGLAVAGRRARETGPPRGTSASTCHRPGHRDQGGGECDSPVARRIAGREPADWLLHFSRANRRWENGAVARAG